MQVVASSSALCQHSTNFSTRGTNPWKTGRKTTDDLQKLAELYNDPISLVNNYFPMIGPENRGMSDDSAAAGREAVTHQHLL